MTHALVELLRDSVAAGLKRRSLTTCSRWACACRVMGRPFPGPWTFKYHPWLREMHDSTAEFNVGRKAAQLGFTEWALNTAFYNIDIKHVDTLYVLPNKTPDASDFSAARFNPALEMSPHLENLFSDVQNVGHKRAGRANLYIRGSQSRSGLKSVPTGLIVLDEVDEMNQDHIPLAMERAAGQVEKQVLAISTPTIPKYGIDRLYQDTTQEHFFFKCPRCSRLTELIFPQCLEITGEHLDDEDLKNTHLKCKECNGTLDHRTKFEWLADGKFVPEYSNRSARGFHVNQLYSSTVSPLDFALAYLRAERDPSEEQELYNSKLGLPHIVKGAGVTDADIDQCLRDHRQESSYQHGRLTTMGIDVGKWLHFEICQWSVHDAVSTTDLNVMAQPKLVKAGKVEHFEQLDELMVKFGVHHGIIDANPERRKAFEFASRFFGRIHLCFYGQSIQGKQIHISKEEELTVNVDRTSWMDLALGRFKTNTIALPCDIGREYRSHIKAPVRRYEKDKNGNAIGRYIKGSEEDHHAHSRVYCEIALVFALELTQAEDVHDAY